MNPAQKALWFIESRLAGALTLDEVAAIAGVSRFHLVRAFAAATGLSVMRYVRARRLSEAARTLANGAPDILSVVLEADYGSHGAFTGGRCAEFRTLQRKLRSADRQWWPRNLDTGQGLSCTGRCVSMRRPAFTWASSSI
jgi:AraC family transcriptional regulator